MIADIRVVRDCGQYTEGPSGLSITVWDHGEEINEIFIWDLEKEYALRKAAVLGKYRRIE